MSHQICKQCFQYAMLPCHHTIELCQENCWTNNPCSIKQWQYVDQKYACNKRQLQKSEKSPTADVKEFEIQEVKIIECKLSLSVPCAFVQIFADNAYSPVHSVIVQLWIDGKLRSSFPEHTFSFTKKQIENHLRDVLIYINQHHNLKLSEYKSFIYFRAEQCPIRPCSPV